MTAGVFYGYVGEVDGLVNRIKQEKNVEPKVIATGGLAKLIANGATTIDKVDSQLTLKGLYLIYQRLNLKG